MLLAGSTRSPSIPNGVLAWFEGDIFKLNLKGKLFDQDKTPVKFMEGATLTLRVLNERREIVKEFECSPDEHGNIEINIDEETTALFPWGKYKGQMLYDDGDKRVTVGVYEIIVGDVDNHRNNKYAVKADFEAWVSRGVKEVAIDENRHLIFTMTDGNVLDLGEANDGGYYQPFVSENGDLNWTPSAPGMIEIPTVNIKGPVGQNGSDGKDGESVRIERVTTSTDPGGVNEVFFSDGSKLQVRNGLNGSGGGGTGDDGGYYTPSISDDGTLTWSASKTGMPMVSPANIKGPAGSDGADGNDGVSVYVTSVEQSEAAGGESVVNFSDGSSVSVFNGKDGGKGESGNNGTSVAITSIVPSTEPGGESVVEFSDGKSLNIRNGFNGQPGGPGPAGPPGSDATVTAESVEAALGFLPALYARNLLENSDFSIAQAGIGGLHGSEPYAADRWKLTSGTASDSNSYVKLNGTVIQQLSEVPSGNVSVFISTISGAASVSYSDGAVIVTGNNAVIDHVEAYEGTYTADSKPAYVKPIPEVEWLKCYSDFVRYSIDSENKVIGVATARSTTVATWVVQLPKAMREAPVFVSKGSAKLLGPAAKNGLKPTMDSSFGNAFVRLNLNTSGLTTGQSFIVASEANGLILDFIADRQ